MHLKGTGYLSGQNIFRPSFPHLFYDHPYINDPLVNSGSSLMGLPWSSTAGLMSYTASTQDAIKYNELSLRCLPGHILYKILI